ncbi:hypothetical protein KEM54_004741 [Ascosphaera aggregata]|nr:hypothetical protein KEM54_004741 [Ascosphaera aggregata]
MSASPFITHAPLTALCMGRPSSKEKCDQEAKGDRKGKEDDKKEECSEATGAPASHDDETPGGTGDKPKDDVKADDGAAGEAQGQSKSLPESSSQPQAPKFTLRFASRNRRALRTEGQLLLERLFEKKREALQGSPSEQWASAIADLAKLEKHACSKCEDKGALGRFECSLRTAGFECQTDSETFQERERAYRSIAEKARPVERRFMDLVAAKISRGEIPGFWLPGVGVGLTHDDWMNVGDNKKRTGGGEPARQAKLAKEREYKGGIRSLKNAGKYDLPPFTVEYVDDERGYAWVANRLIPRGEQFWRETVYSFTEPRDDKGDPDDWERRMKEILESMNEGDRRHFMILPQDVRDIDTLSGKKLDKCTRIFRRWSIGAEGDRPGEVNKLYAPGVAFLNHSCIPNAQQTVGITRVVPSELDRRLEEAEAKLRAAKKRNEEDKAKGKRKAKAEAQDEDKDKGKAKGKCKDILSLLRLKESQSVEPEECEILEKGKGLETVRVKSHLAVYLHAVKDIEPGTEITIQYLNVFMDQKSRNELLMTTFGFECCCHVCRTDLQKEFDTALIAVDEAIRTRTLKSVRLRPVRHIHEASGAIWSVLSLDIWDFRLPRIMEDTGDMFAIHQDLGRAFFFYMMAERLYLMVMLPECGEYLRIYNKTNSLFKINARSKRGASTIDDSLMIFLNEEYICEMLLMLGCNDKKYRRLPHYRKNHPWLKWFDREKYKHERTQMELDLIADWTAGWMEDRISYFYKHGSMKGVQRMERRKRKGLPENEKHNTEEGGKKGVKQKKEKVKLRHKD